MRRIQDAHVTLDWENHCIVFGYDVLKHIGPGDKIRQQQFLRTIEQSFPEGYDSVTVNSQHPFLGWVYFTDNDGRDICDFIIQLLRSYGVAVPVR